MYMTIHYHGREGMKRDRPHPKFGFSAQGCGKDEQKETAKEKCAHQMFRPESMNVAAGLPSAPLTPNKHQTDENPHLYCTLIPAQTNKPAMPLSLTRLCSYRNACWWPWLTYQTGLIACLRICLNKFGTVRNLHVPVLRQADVWAAAA
ncbi:hypothetical protein LZ32DRAFT_607737 [Colletotrichum eremochloae]|nr:hypothetical protein LZ32DRAFT_607737 [Colletotrichum eremochloae]